MILAAYNNTVTLLQIRDRGDGYTRTPEMDARRDLMCFGAERFDAEVHAAMFKEVCEITVSDSHTEKNAILEAAFHMHNVDMEAYEDGRVNPLLPKIKGYDGSLYNDMTSMSVGDIVRLEHNSSTGGQTFQYFMVESFGFKQIDFVAEEVAA